MKTKQCFKCGENKDISEFYPHPMMRDGHLGKCKECAKRDMAKYRAKNPERIREYERKRGKLPRRLALETKRKQRFRKEYPERCKTMWKVQQQVRRAVRSGRIEKPTTCSVCGGSRRIEGHHPDYSKPLEVEWLCSACHKQLHFSKRRNDANKERQETENEFA